jgi:transposase
MGKPHPIELRERVVACVEEGHSHRSAAARFRVSVKFVNDMVILKRETGGLQPRSAGQWRRTWQAGAGARWIEARMAQKGDLTLDDLVAELADRHGIAIHRVSVWRFLRGLGPDTQKKPSAPSSRSGLTSCRRATSGSRGASPSCATCCRASVSSTKPR